MSKEPKSATVKCIYYQKSYPLHIMVIVLCLATVLALHKRAKRIPCTESNKTMRKVEKCPTNKTSWNERSRLKDCREIEHECSNKSLDYHCLLDLYGVSLIEVCALPTKIKGRKCAEYNSAGKIIQEHYEKDCEKCPFSFSSRNSYLYSECFEIKSTKTTENVTKKRDSSSLEDPSADSLSVLFCILLPTLAMALMVVFMILKALGVQLKTRKRDQQIPEYAPDIMHGQNGQLITGDSQGKSSEETPKYDDADNESLQNDSGYNSFLEK